MNLLVAPSWIDYQLLDSGDGLRLEKFGPYRLIRPDPQAIWKPSLSESEWKKFDGKFENKGEKGRWVKKTKMPDKWVIRYNNRPAGRQGISMYCKLTPFKHTGVFPEQSIHWDWLSSVITRDVPDGTSRSDLDDIKIAMSSDVRRSPRNDEPPNVLNLFGYTGGSTLAAAAAGAKVTHVDASYPAIGWARDNQILSDLSDSPIRWILDDAIKFCQREVKRGVKYDGIILDPPIYGHGPKGETWDFNISFPILIGLCNQLLSANPLFVIVNAYAISASSVMLENVLTDYLPEGNIESGELALKEQSGRLLSTGIFARWKK